MNWVFGNFGKFAKGDACAVVEEGTWMPVAIGKWCMSSDELQYQGTQIVWTRDAGVQLVSDTAYHDICLSQACKAAGWRLFMLLVTTCGNLDMGGYRQRHQRAPHRCVVCVLFCTSMWCWYVVYVHVCVFMRMYVCVYVRVYGCVVCMLVAYVHTFMRVCRSVYFRPDGAPSPLSVCSSA